VSFTYVFVAAASCTKGGETEQEWYSSGCFFALATHYQSHGKRSDQTLNQAPSTHFDADYGTLRFIAVRVKICLPNRATKTLALDSKGNLRYT
jgi:hypothetical protein